MVCCHTNSCLQSNHSKARVFYLVPKLFRHWQTRRKEITLGEVTYLSHGDFRPCLLYDSHYDTRPAVVNCDCHDASAHSIALSMNQMEEFGIPRNTHTGLPRVSSQAHKQQSQTFGSEDRHKNITKPPDTSGELSSHITPHRNRWDLSVTKTSSPKLLLQGIAGLKRSLGPTFLYISYDVSLVGCAIPVVAELYFWMCLCVPAPANLWRFQLPKDMTPAFQI